MALSLLRHKCFDITRQIVRSDYLRVSSIRYYAINNTTTTKINERPNLENSKNEKFLLDESKRKVRKAKFKLIVKAYGKTVVIFHIAQSLLSLGLFYLLVSSGIDMTPVIDWMTQGKTQEFNDKLANASTFLIAYGVHKLFAPVRIGITIVLAPFIVRFFQRIGIVKRAPLKIVDVKK